jgi:hypothetical protein
MTNEETKCLAGNAIRELWTTSRDKCFRSCPREHAYRYDMGYSPVSDRSALLFGTLVHAGLEAWWSEPCKTKRLASSISAFRKAVPTDYDPYEAAKIEALLIGYDTRWADEDFTTIAVEREFRTSLVHPSTGERSPHFDRGGKIDAIAHDNKRRRVCGIEHKTSSLDIEPGSSYWQTLRVDGQSTNYFVGASSLELELDEFIYDMIGKPKLKPYKATPVARRKYTQEKRNKKTGELIEASRLYSNQREFDETVEDYFTRLAEDIATNPDDYYRRVSVVRLEREMVEAAAETYDVAEFSAEAKRAGFAPKNMSACHRYNTLCDFLPVCLGEASLKDERLYRRSDKKHAELSTEVQQS